ncbi:helix-turn-helix domain-containing protein [Aureibacillus halotolerans]|uniref:Helix-turn-helix protein n=1 Tax=Aureibacillus halotolerans TaxID=1508390 RepID=A0A4R6TPX3_9BACI|nr:helix-turn-helix domain-containing protein [Aureibacillus halotolerans]TDQ32143.1 helix-turn-helix protein [Aureibacillus halotolerans]
MGRTKAEEKATNRFQMIAPLLNEELDNQERGRLLKQICVQHGLSVRTLRRYLSQFKENGFEELKQKPYRSVPEERQDKVLVQAILLRREVPSRSIASIIQILEWDGLVEKGVLKRAVVYLMKAFHFNQLCEEHYFCLRFS